MMPGRILAGLFAVTPFGLLLATNQQPKKVDYTHDVYPILSAHCSKCHFGDQKLAGLLLDSRAEILRGRVVIPGKSASSALLVRILGQGGMPRMPMGFAPLSDSDISTIRTWIDQGCIESTSGNHKHWAYVKPIRPKLPKVSNTQWVRNPIDAFVLSRLDQLKLKPSPAADRTTLIRRLCLDLTGLPPSPAEVDAFVADSRPDAYDRLVDRLFASPHYGERMALPWLDAARYADSNGFQQDGDTFQYVWRDWVVKALNDNMPFDQFTVEQLAGDLLPTKDVPENVVRNRQVATAFNRNHMLNGEGGAIPEEQRNVGLFDRVDTTSTTWLGLTMTCARCHDHKYDPLSQKDYYSLMAFFNNVPESGVPSDVNGPYYIAKPWVYAGTDEEMANFKALEGSVTEANRNVQKDEQSPELPGLQAQWEATTLKALDDTKTAQQLKVPVNIAAALKVPSGKRDVANAKVVRDYFLENGLTGSFKETRTKWHDLEKQLAEARNRLPKVMVMSDAQPRQTHIYSRGNYEAPLADVAASTPASLPSMPTNAPKNRLGLARWIISPENPLTARVQVNRYWQQFFGKGLVKTPENFGVQSEAPVNPELLDWLAVEFRESGWNVKRLQRLIVTSSTYRQSSKVSPTMVKMDPDNRYLARGARFRLPSMVIRDAALAASGLINLKVGGKPVYPYQPKAIWDGLNITDERDFSYPQSNGADLYRRSIYTFWRRTVKPGDMFDSSSRQVCTVRPSQTSTPLHALTTLNDVAWVEAGRALAEKVMRESKANSKGRLIDAFRRVCARTPSVKELAILQRALTQSISAFQSDPASATAYLRQGDSKRDAKLDPIEEAGYASVCLAILNLDEALTRE